VQLGAARRSRVPRRARRGRAPERPQRQKRRRVPTWTFKPARRRAGTQLTWFQSWLLTQRTRHLVAVAARRSGKTVGVRALAIAAALAPGAGDIGYMAPTLGQAKRLLWRPLMEDLRDPAARVRGRQAKRVRPLRSVPDGRAHLLLLGRSLRARARRRLQALHHRRDGRPALHRRGLRRRRLARPRRQRRAPGPDRYAA